jgi:hypothetical protein
MESQSELSVKWTELKEPQNTESNGNENKETEESQETKSRKEKGFFLEGVP